jgi:hypothetical protein
LIAGKLSGRTVAVGAEVGSDHPRGERAHRVRLALSRGDVIVSLLVSVASASATIVGPVVDYLVGGDKTKPALDELKGWLGFHDVVMTVLFLVIGVDLIANGLGLLA